MIFSRLLATIVVLLFISLFGSGSYAAKLAEPGMEEKGRLVTMDFEGVELKTLIKFIGELTGKNFVVDERVRGRATVVSPTKIRVDEAYRVFESILEVHGYTTVPAGRVIKVVPATIARGKSLTTNVGTKALPGADNMITQVIPISYGDVNDVKNLFTPLISKESLLVAYQPTNTLIVTDILSNINRLLKILREVDIPGYELTFTVIPLRHASAKLVAQELKELFEARKRARAVPRPRGKEVVEIRAQEELKLIPDERTNSLIVLATAQTIKMIKGILETLDQEIPRGKGNIHIYYLQHAVAEDLATVLGGVTKEAKEGPRAAPQAVKEKLPVLGEKIAIIADKPTNSLIIIASPQDYTVIEDVIRKLDIVRAQVYVEALIAEVTLDKVKDLGVEWNITEEAQSGKYKRYGGTNFGLTDAERAGALSGLIVGVTKGVIPVGGVDVADIKGLLHLFSRDSDVNILSTPKLLTTDNEEAEIIVAEERPFLQSSQVTPEGSTVKTFQFKDVGITLKITPHISKGKLLRLNLFTEIKSFVEQVEGEVGAVVTTKRQANTSVIVEDGSTVVIGGLIRDDKTERVSKVPLLGDVPLLGWLFKAKNQTKVKTNLLIFITPRIVTSAEHLRKITEREKLEENKHVKDYRKEKKKIFPIFEDLFEEKSVPSAAGVEEEPAGKVSVRRSGLGVEKATIEEGGASTTEGAKEIGDEVVASVKEEEKEGVGELAAAQNLMDVSIDRSHKDTLILRVRADGRVGVYDAFTLKKPARLVIDFWNVRRKFPRRTIIVDSPYLERVRFGDHPRKVRIVLEMSTETFPYHQIERAEDELWIALGKRSKVQAAVQEVEGGERIFPLAAPRTEEIVGSFAEDADDDSGGESFDDE